MNDQAEMRRLDPSSSGFGEVVDMVNYLKDAAAPLIVGHPDPIAAQSMLMSAAATFAGTLFGQLLVTGAVTDRDRRRAAEMAAKNFRAGIEVGKRAATRVIIQNCEGEA